ncbi:MAG: hypothetical protein COV10_04440 [Candidatus Vogelbacteria bacterium CG10_big_fil_rev_8_21_14_0_10_51_16]|uniref:EfeO-type cupredoxin-like domain-containing protein n=1 Tax=Candidatus Vogelbacteria bacterium CG10_big_fil_rev_8_21_14_0_10_51_16 TaxID=1975045 RepID=A0A2H0REN0_9BACT|nr:MAG: hypothetical protein COV10_04440 [Candidatus Vogelbacteria bacterium CG10_big_fil_rev_8_21_14_0_10_51_16]
MTIDQVIVIVVGILLIGFVYWSFLKRKPKAEAVASGTVEITVQGGYRPEIISVSLGKPTTLVFHRTDSSSCLEEVLIPDFKIRKQLPLNERVSITIVPQKAGTYQFSCGMNMFHGKIIVE